MARERGDSGVLSSAASNASSVYGDESRRVTVPMPTSYGELRFAASRHHGRGGPVKIVHGRTNRRIDDQRHLAHVRDGDVLIVRPIEKNDEPAEQHITTSQAHFVKHPLEPRTTPTRRQNSSALADTPFEGKSSYNLDFIGHPPQHSPKSAKTAPHKVDNLWKSEGGPMEKTMYTTEFQWHNVTPRTPRKPRSDGARTPTRFDGTSSYNTDFVKHPMEARTRSVPRAMAAAPAAAEPFDGNTTYGTDFRKWAGEGRPATARPRRMEASPTQPFEGRSEYNREYKKHPENDRNRPVVHIEPEVPKMSRTSSAPAASRGRRRERPF